MNGLKLVLRRKTLQKFLQTYNPKILCLNETKLTEADIPDVRKKLKPFFDSMHFTCATNRRNYGGVAILYNSQEIHDLETKTAEQIEAEENDYDAEDPTVITGVSNIEEDADLDVEGRIIAKIFKSFVLVSVYTPHSGVGDLKRLQYRVERWDRAFEAYINRLKE